MLWRLRFLGGVFRGVTRRRSWAPSAATPGPTGENKAQVTPRYCPATPVVSRLWVLRLMKRIGDTECLLSVPPNRIESQKECARGWPSGPRGAWCWCCCCCCGGPGVSALRLGAGCQLATIGLPPQSPAHHPNALVLVLMALLLPLLRRQNPLALALLGAEVGPVQGAARSSQCTAVAVRGATGTAEPSRT